MSENYKTPGVYRREIFLRPEAPLQTGVPAFVGFVKAADASDTRLLRPVALTRKEEFFAKFGARPGGEAAGLEASADGYLADAVQGFFSNGGTRCYVVPAHKAASDWEREAALKAAVDALSNVHDFDLVAVPDAMVLYSATAESLASIDSVMRVQRHVIAHCAEHNDRFAVLDALPGRTTETVLEQRKELAKGVGEPFNAALYFPWIKVYDADLEARAPASRGLRYTPPSGHVAGIYARVDTERGVHKAPANEGVLGAIDLETGIDHEQQARLNPEGVNCLRHFPGRGIRVWGARTLSREAAWRYVNIRRQFLTINRWVMLNMAWANFEPNVSRLWVRIERELSAYLETLWHAGGLLGETRGDAFYVKCDDETNPSEVREAGRVVTEVGLALGAPSEFVVVRIFHRAGTTTVS